MRKFETGATRDDVEDKLDYEGSLSPMVLERYAEYMHLHRVQADGELRDADNWQAGIPRKEYIRSIHRHFMDLWFLWRGHIRRDKKDGHIITIQEACCALLFNVMGFLHETLKEEKSDAVR